MARKKTSLSPAKSDRTEALLIHLNRWRAFCGWTWPELREHCLEVFSVQPEQMSIKQLEDQLLQFIGLHKFQQWKKKRAAA